MGRWYQGVSRAQWLVFLVASAGLIFDGYAAQIYTITRNDMLGEILHRGAGDPAVKFWGELFLGIYLVGGMVGGLYFGSLADRIGRRPTLIITILVYTVFCGLIGLAQFAWQVAVLRFAVAMGAAGAWAVGASYVAEVFAARSRAQAGAIFHSTANLGIWLAALVGLAVGANWRLAYLVGAIPALLVFGVRAGAQESPGWKEQAGKPGSPARGSFKELLLVRPWGSRAILGMLLAAVGLGTYWCLFVGAQDLTQQFLIRHGVPAAAALGRAKFAYGFLVNGGAFLGVMAFGPIAQWLGRRKAFACAMVGGMLIVPVTWYLPQTYGELLVLLPIYGFVINCFHAGFAFYFPELFPTHLRGTGAGFCFNGGRLLAAGILVLSAWLKSRPGLELREAACLLALLYLFGLLCVKFLPETKGEQLAEMP